MTSSGAPNNPAPLQASGLPRAWDAQHLGHPDPDTANLLFAHYVGLLKGYRRSGWLRQDLPCDVESVAEHSHRTAVLAVLSSLKLPADMDRWKVVAMAVLHDVPEVLVGDLRPQDSDRKTKDALETEAMRRLVQGLEGEAPLLALWNEFQEGRSREARLVHSLDKLEMALQALEYGRRHPGFDAHSFIKSATREIQDSSVKDLLRSLLTKKWQTLLAPETSSHSTPSEQHPMSAT